MHGDGSQSEMLHGELTCSRNLWSSAILNVCDHKEPLGIRGQPTSPERSSANKQVTEQIKWQVSLVHYHPVRKFPFSCSISPASWMVTEWKGSLTDTHCPRLPWVSDRRNLPSSFVFSSVHHRSPFGMLQIPFQSNKKTHNTLLYQKDIFRKGQINKDSHVQLFYMHFFINVRIMLYPLFLSSLFEPKWTVNGTHKSVLWHFLVHRIGKSHFYKKQQW